MNNNELYQSYQQIQESERNRIARELHDTSLQDLAHLTHKIELAELYMEKDIIQAKLELEGINQELKRIINQVRNTIFNLRPMSFDDIGLKETIESYIHNELDHTDIVVKGNIDTLVLDSKEEMLNIYRIIQECIQNVIKHANAKTLSIELKDELSEITIIVKDDGVGFDTDLEIQKENHFGLRIVSERVTLMMGTIEIHSKKEYGTEIIIYLPKRKRGKDDYRNCDNR